MSDHLASTREAMFRDFKPEPLTDKEPVFVLVPATTSDIYHFCAKHRVQRENSRDPLFALGACVGITMGGQAPIVCGVIQVGRPVKRHIGDSYVAQVLVCAHDIVPGIRRFLFDRAVRASRALGFHSLTVWNETDESLLLESGFQRHADHWLQDLTRLPILPQHEGHERVALPGKPPIDSIDV